MQWEVQVTGRIYGISPPPLTHGKSGQRMGEKKCEGISTYVKARNNLHGAMSSLATAKYLKIYYKVNKFISKNFSDKEVVRKNLYLWKVVIVSFNLNVCYQSQYGPI